LAIRQVTLKAGELKKFARLTSRRHLISCQMLRLAIRRTPDGIPDDAVLLYKAAILLRVDECFLATITKLAMSSPAEK